MKKIFFLLVPCSLCFVPCALSQNVGIGTTTPAFKLDVSGGSINTDSVYRINGSKVLSIKLHNTLLGIGSGSVLAGGVNNTANGYEALYSNTTGSNNTANGHQALYSNTTASYNTAH